MHADVWDIASDGSVNILWTDANGGEFRASLYQPTPTELYGSQKKHYLPGVRRTPSLISLLLEKRRSMIQRILEG